MGLKMNVYRILTQPQSYAQKRLLQVDNINISYLRGTLIVTFLFLAISENQPKLFPFGETQIRNFLAQARQQAVHALQTTAPIKYDRQTVTSQQTSITLLRKSFSFFLLQAFIDFVTSRSFSSQKCLTPTTHQILREFSC